MSSKFGSETAILIFSVPGRICISALQITSYQMAFFKWRIWNIYKNWNLSSRKHWKQHKCWICRSRDSTSKFHCKPFQSANRLAWRLASTLNNMERGVNIFEIKSGVSGSFLFVRSVWWIKPGTTTPTILFPIAHPLLPCQLRGKVLKQEVAGLCLEMTATWQAGCWREAEFRDEPPGTKHRATCGTGCEWWTLQMGAGLGGTYGGAAVAGHWASEEGSEWETLIEVVLETCKC